jgi:hypothetical protein
LFSFFPPISVLESCPGEREPRETLLWLLSACGVTVLLRFDFIFCSGIEPSKESLRELSPPLQEIDGAGDGTRKSTKENESRQGET